MLRIALITLMAVSLLGFLLSAVFVRPRRRKLVATSCSFAAFVGFLIAGMVHADRSFHRTTDEVRVRNVHAIFDTLIRYRDKAARCPLSDRNDGPVGVNISNRPLDERFNRPPPGARGSIAPYADFLADVRSVVGPGVSFPDDPEKVPHGDLNFYQYHLSESGEYFFVAATLHAARPGTVAVRDWYYKYELRAPCKPSAAGTLSD